MSVANRRPFTAEETTRTRELKACTFAVASWDKRFARDLNEALGITDKQAAWLHIQHHRYRRQIPSHVCDRRCPPQGADRRRWAAEAVNRPGAG